MTGSLALTSPTATADPGSSVPPGSASSSDPNGLGPITDAIPHSSLSSEYAPPAPSPLSPDTPAGTLLATSPAPHLLNIVGKSLPGYAQRIRYSSINDQDQAVEVTGYVIEPTNKWQGAGPTPTVVMGPGTRGAGDQCAPSASGGLFSSLHSGGNPALSVNVNYELPLQYIANSLGMRIVMTDYIGLGTPGIHSYVNTLDEGRAMLDAARAGLKAAEAPADSPIGFAGYSQGGGASAAATELKDIYAPELNLVGSFAGAPPADLKKVMASVDGSSIVTVLGYAVNGFIERNPELTVLLDEELNGHGKRFLHDAKTACFLDSTAQWGFTNTRDLTKTGESFSQLVERRSELSKILEAQKLGNRPISVPMLVTNSRHDDIIPFEQARTMARSYCSQGATVEVHNTDIPPIFPEIKPGLNHALPIFTDIPIGLKYLMDRFNGLPAGNDCGTF